MSNEIVSGKLNQALYQIFTQETPKAEIRTRQGRGGRLLLYTDGAYVIKTLNQAFGWNWDFDTDQAEVLYIGDRPFEVKCRGRLTVRAGDTVIVKTQYGCQPIEMLKDGSAPVSLGDAYKGAATDALKKCASLLGIALDLYDSDSEVNTANPQQLAQEIRQAKQAPQQPKPAPSVGPSGERVEAPKSELNTHFGDNPRQAQPASGINSPQAAITEAHRLLGQAYYNTTDGKPNVSHAFNALKQEIDGFSWPSPKDGDGWRKVVTTLVSHVRKNS